MNRHLYLNKDGSITLSKVDDSSIKFNPSKPGYINNYSNINVQKDLYDLSSSVRVNDGVVAVYSNAGQIRSVHFFKETDLRSLTN